VFCKKQIAKQITLRGKMPEKQDWYSRPVKSTKEFYVNLAYLSAQMGIMLKYEIYRTLEMQ